MCSKQFGLWEVFNEQVVGPRMLPGISGRNSWLSAWKANREKRFAKVAKVNHIPSHILKMCSPQALTIYSDGLRWGRFGYGQCAPRTLYPPACTLLSRCLLCQVAFVGQVSMGKWRFFRVFQLAPACSRLLFLALVPVICSGQPADEGAVVPLLLQ